jgi:hypothetical protein
MEVEQCASVLRSGPASTATFDYEQAVAMIRSWPSPMSVENETRLERLRNITLILILESQPPWRWLLPLGRGKLAEYLPADARQVFDSAGLYGASDDPNVRSWWDSVAQRIRAGSDESHLQVGRAGEDLTIAHEKRILAEGGRGDLRPELVGFEDTTLGYDVSSFTISGAAVRPKFIEVKTTEMRPLRFTFTSTQWAAALRLQPTYFVHVWHLPTAELVEISFAELSTAIPENRGRGNWETAIITWQ